VFRGETGDGERTSPPGGAGIRITYAFRLKLHKHLKFTNQPTAVYRQFMSVDESFFIPLFCLSTHTMPRIRTSRTKPPPEGFEDIQ
jgi:hypothetical protein